VVMFEPSRCVISQDSRTGTAHDVLTEAIIAAGFHRIPAGPPWTGRPAQGWGLYRTADGLVLRDPDGAIYAEGTTALDPAWVSTATSLGSVLVLHGPCLGIRTPPGRTQACYTVDDGVEGPSGAKTTVGRRGRETAGFARASGWAAALRRGAGSVAGDRAVDRGAGDGEQFLELADGVSAGGVQRHQVSFLAGGELGLLAA
jgi:hypothetical protein